MFDKAIVKPDHRFLSTMFSSSITDGYSTRDIVFKWEVKHGDGMMFVPAGVKMLPQYKLVELKLKEVHTAYVIGALNRNN